MKVKAKREKPLKWFVLPNESYKWDFILAQYEGESFEQESAEYSN